jgi:sugar/nucleoside kinase (ribokinase family)
MNQSHKASIKIMRHFKNSGSKIGINISLYLAKMGINKNKEILRLSDVIILNFQEAQAITNKENIQDIYNEFYKYTNAIIVITDGSRAIHASDSKNIYFKNFKPIKPVDTTGAGDAFATGFIYGLIKNKSVPESINLGHKEALSVLKGIGAKNTLLKKL